MIFTDYYNYFIRNSGLPYSPRGTCFPVRRILVWSCQEGNLKTRGHGKRCSREVKGVSAQPPMPISPDLSRVFLNTSSPFPVSKLLDLADLVSTTRISSILVTFGGKLRHFRLKCDRDRRLTQKCNLSGP